MPDDFPRNFLGAAHGLTPTLDRLRATGVNFARAYTTAPLCSPSRYCVITGRHASSGLTKHAAAGEARGGGGGGSGGGGGGDHPPSSKELTSWVPELGLYQQVVA